jgi:hypothetical protein
MLQCITIWLIFLLVVFFSPAVSNDRKKNKIYILKKTCNVSNFIFVMTGFIFHGFRFFRLRIVNLPKKNQSIS